MKLQTKEQIELELKIGKLISEYRDTYSEEEFIVNLLTATLIDEIATATFDDHETKNYLRFTLPQKASITGSIYLDKKLISSMSTATILLKIEGIPQKFRDEALKIAVEKMNESNNFRLCTKCQISYDKKDMKEIENTFVCVTCFPLYNEI